MRVNPGRDPEPSAVPAPAIPAAPASGQGRAATPLAAAVPGTAAVPEPAAAMGAAAGPGPGVLPDGIAAPGRAVRAAPAAPPRRDFLWLTGAAAGAGLISACRAAPPQAAGSAARASGRPLALPRSPAAPRTAAPASPAAPGPAGWAALRHSLSTGRLVRRDDPGYRTARLLFDPRFDYQRPAAVAYCATPGDVAACLAFVRRFGLPVTARSGGHSYGGWSGTSGLIIDVSAMNSFHAGPGPGQVTAGTGMRLVDFYSELGSRGLAVPGGSCPAVGIAGLTLGGGVGVLSRAYGLTCDNLEAVQMVTADGRVLDCSPSQHSDLFWACRGGGGGNFGVATSFTFRTRPLSQLVLFFLTWPWAQAASVVAAWQSWAPFAPDALWSNLHLSAPAGGSTFTVQVGGTYLGSPGQAGQLLQELYARVGSPPSSTYLQETPYLAAMLLEAGCSGMTVPECHLPWQAPGGQLAREPSFTRSDFVTRPLPAAAIRALVTGVERLQQVRGAAGGAGSVAFDALGGAVNRVHPADTAFVHRSALYLVQYYTGWSGGPAGAGARRQRAWLDSVYAGLHPHASGEAYQNYPDPRLPGWQAAYYGANYPRLAQVKTAYDPQRLFRFPQGITPG